MTKAEVLQHIEAAVAMLSHSFVFGYFDLDDIQQQARQYALEALPRYKPACVDGRPTKPLGNFLFRHCKNRLINLRRDKYRRTKPPCTLCHRAAGGRTEHPDGDTCTKYKLWRKRNDAKASLCRPVGIDGVADERESRMRDADRTAEAAELDEVLSAIDEHLPVDLRADYLRMRAGEPPPKARREKVEEAVAEILRLRRGAEA